MNGCVTVTEAARIKKVTRQAIYLAIRLKKLKAYMHDDKWRIFLKDLKEYDDKRFSRKYHALYEGKPVFDESKGFFSVDKASELMGIIKQKLYYAIRTGRLKALRKGAAYVIHVDDLFKYQAEYLKTDYTSKKA